MLPKNRVECGDYNCTIFAIFLQKSRVGRGANAENSLKIRIALWLLTITGVFRTAAG